MQIIYIHGGLDVLNIYMKWIIARCILELTTRI